MATFAYVYYWHGAYDYLLYWAILQWFGVFIEAMAAKLLKTKTLQHLEVSVELKTSDSSIRFKLILVPRASRLPAYI